MGRINDIGRIIGQRSNKARNYFDQLLSLEESALILNVRISELRDAARACGTINGRPAPKVHTVTPAGKIFFDGSDIKTLLNQPPANSGK